MPILAYANLRGQQPAESRFTIERHADGVTLTDPPDPQRARGNRMTGALMLVLAGIWAAFVAHEFVRNWRLGELSWLIYPTFVGTLGALLWLDGRRAARQPLVLEARGGRLVVRRGTLRSSDGRREFSRADLHKITVPIGTPSLPTMRLISGVYVSPKLGFATPLFTNRPKEECEWVAEELRRALGLTAGLLSPEVPSPELPAIDDAK
jgi:hypothetical protein